MGQTLEYLLRLQDQFSSPLKNARDEQGRFTAGTKKFGESAGAVNSLSGAFVGLAAKIGAAFTAYKALELGFAGFKSALSAASEMETTQTAFKTMLGSQNAMLETLGDIKKLAMSTPFEFPELANAGRMLLAFGEAAKDIPDALRRIGDVASGVAAPIGEIAEIYGKARTQGILFAEDINQLTGRGIPIIREFAKILGQPESAIKKLAEEGKITFPLLDQAFRNLTGTGGQFFGMMADQAKTSAGLWSTLKDGVNELFLALGTPLNDAIKPVLTDAIGLADQLRPAIAELGTHMGTALGAVRDFIAEAKEGSGLATAMGEALMAMFADVAAKMMGPFKAAFAGLSVIGNDLMSWLAPVAEWFSAKMESAALLFGRALMRQMAEVMAALPMKMGEGAALTLNKAANQSGKQGNLANARANDAAAEVRSGSGLANVAASLEKGMAAFRDSFSQQNQPAANPNALPPSVLDKGYNPMFPGGVLPPGAVAGKGALPPSVLDGPGGKGAPASFFDELAGKAGQKAAPAGGNAAGLDAALAGVNTPAAAAKKDVAKAVATVKPPMSAAKPVDAGMTPGMPRATPMERINTAMGTGAEDGAGEGRKIRGYSQAQGGRRMGLGEGGPLSERRATPNVPSPGTARRSQERREAAATAAKAGGGEHPLMGIIKSMQAKLDTLAVAT